MARAIAIERAKMNIQHALLDERIAARDAFGVKMIDGVLTSTTRWLSVLLA